MPKRSSPVLPNDRPNQPTDARISPPFLWNTVQRTVIKFVEPLGFQQTIAAPDQTEAVMVAMQRLVTMINTLQASPRSPLEDTSKRLLSKAQTLAALIPYVSEEAYDVLEALQEAESRQTQHSTLNALPPGSPLITIDTLIPSLLWCLARSSYSMMQLIEGARVRCWQPEQGWAFGMLRLVVMLKAETSIEHWCFDLATGYPVEALLEPTAIVQSDEHLLPIRPLASAEDGTSSADCQAGRQLEAILQSLKTERFGLQTLLQGIAVELLQPGSDWQAGNLQLQLGFDFSAQTLDAISSHEDLRLPELIEAELMEEGSRVTPNKATQFSTAAPFTQTIASRMTQAHVSIVNPVGQALSPTTLVQVTDADRLGRYTQLFTQQQLAQSLVQPHHQQTHSDDEQTQLRLIVQAAIACAHQLRTPDIDLAQPMLLMDELVPKLLWSLTSSTGEIMQLLGGIPAQVLQPNADWQQGTLRLVAALHLKAADVEYILDLSTGRSVLTNMTPLELGTIVQTSTTMGSQPNTIETLTADLTHQLDHAMLAYRILRDGVAIKWLEDVEQDWQPGAMQLSLSLAFVADTH
ncbi:hypothetical protein [Stenomitos frigidus]|uniref:Uncharacterized protein n=1 Tax=Stenomitos frigidus ULC18 TaxID=2107698 RepID=A0A2T1DUT3_9CYAN|nr:hypothetical protein [Stenomitos frigidus]PSB24258.1 hypothetical protein C7B82_27640 [Stenomitos frigidus ULC18]